MAWYDNDEDEDIDSSENWMLKQNWTTPSQASNANSASTMGLGFGVTNFQIEDPNNATLNDPELGDQGMNSGMVGGILSSIFSGAGFLGNLAAQTNKSEGDVVESSRVARGVKGIGDFFVGKGNWAETKALLSGETDEDHYLDDQGNYRKKKKDVVLTGYSGGQSGSGFF
jgi:hypothetical protein